MKYGYKFLDCTIQEYRQYINECYHWKKDPAPEEKFNFKFFDSVQHGKSLIGHILIPKSATMIGNEKWTLEGNLLLKEVTFDSVQDANTYQTAIERAWALGGHLDPRVVQSYYE